MAPRIYFATLTAYFPAKTMAKTGVKT